MIYDCFSYLDEDLLLNLRLNILDKYVDYFVIVEGNKTWQNNSKELKFDINKYEKFKDKIMEDSKTHLPKNWSKHHLKDQSQRNYILNGLNNFNDDDWIIISDLDEIPNPKTICNFDPKFKFAVFQQKLFYYKFNLISPNNFWYGSRIVVKKFLKSPQWLRNFKVKKKNIWVYKRRNKNY